jgi:hypothetical protein
MSFRLLYIRGIMINSSEKELCLQVKKQVRVLIDNAKVKHSRAHDIAKAFKSSRVPGYT